MSRTLVRLMFSNNYPDPQECRIEFFAFADKRVKDAID